MEKTSLTFTGTPEEIRSATSAWRIADIVRSETDSDPIQAFDLAGVVIGTVGSGFCHTLESLVDDLRAQIRNKTDDCTEAQEYAWHWEVCYHTVADLRDRLIHALEVLKANPHPGHLQATIEALEARLETFNSSNMWQARKIHELEASLTLARAGSDKNFDDARLWQGRAVASQKEVDSLREAVAQLQLDLKELRATNVKLYNRIHNAKAALES